MCIMWLYLVDKTKVRVVHAIKLRQLCRFLMLFFMEKIMLFLVKWLLVNALCGFVLFAMRFGAFEKTGSAAGYINDDNLVNR